MSSLSFVNIITFMQIRFGRHSLLLLMPFFVSACASPPKGIIILCAGDSITAQAYPHFLQQLFNAQAIRAKVLNYGRSGFTSGEYLRFLQSGRDRLASEKPDFILLELGTNDVRADLDFTPAGIFQANMKQIIAIFRAFRSRTGKSPEILLATIPPVPKETPFPFTADSVLRVEGEINPAIKSISDEERLPLVDNYALFSKEPNLLAGVHPSREGYRRLARHWFDALKSLISK